MKERASCLALLIAIGVCASADASPPASTQAIDAKADAVAAADPGVRDCEADVDTCLGIARLDPDPVWQTGLSRLADARLRQCQQGDAASCYRAWMYGARSHSVLERGCALGLPTACTEIGSELVRAARDRTPTSRLQMCQRGAEATCRPEGACSGPSPCAALEAEWKATPPRLLPSNTMEARRIVGERNLLPPHVVKVQMVQVGRPKIVAAIKLCLDARGAPERVTFLKSSGFRGYDQLLREQIRGWRYRPLEIDGKPAPVCTAVTFVYQQR